MLNRKLLFLLFLAVPLRLLCYKNHSISLILIPHGLEITED